MRDSINVRGILVRNGWKTEQKREKLKLLNEIKTIKLKLEECEMTFRKDSEEIFSNTEIVEEQNDILKEKIALVQARIRDREKQNKEIIQAIKRQRKEHEQLHRRYKKRMDEYERLQKEWKTLHNKPTVSESCQQFPIQKLEHLQPSQGCHKKRVYESHQQSKMPQLVNEKKLQVPFPPSHKKSTTSRKQLNMPQLVNEKKQKMPSPPTNKSSTITRQQVRNVRNKVVQKSALDNSNNTPSPPSKIPVRKYRRLPRITNRARNSANESSQQ